MAKFGSNQQSNFGDYEVKKHIKSKTEWMTPTIESAALVISSLDLLFWKRPLPKSYI